MNSNNILLLFIVGLFLLNISNSCENFGKRQGRSSIKYKYKRIMSRDVSKWKNKDKKIFYEYLQSQDRYFELKSISIKYKYLMTVDLDEETINDPEKISLIDEENIRLKNIAEAKFEKAKEELFALNRIKYECKCLDKGELLSDERGEEEEEEMQYNISEFHKKDPKLNGRSCFDVCAVESDKNNPDLIKHKNICKCDMMICKKSCFGYVEDDINLIIIFVIISILSLSSWFKFPKKIFRFKLN